MTEKCTYFGCENAAIAEVTVTRGSGNASQPKKMCQAHLTELQVSAVVSSLPVRIKVTELPRPEEE
jgi:hypothetical protein